MVDNVQANSGIGGATFATDEITGVHYPYAKMAWGANNTVTLVDTSTGAIPIQDGGNTITVDNGGTFAVQVDEFPTAASITDNFATPSTTSIMAMGMLYDGSAWDMARGDATNGLLVNLGANNDVTVTGTVTANAGTGTFAVSNAALSVTGGGTEASALRVTIASDSTGVLSIDDNGGAITVDNGGTFAVQATVAAGATNIAKAEDAASADADVGVPAMAVRKATPANTSGTDGDYEFLQMSAGRLWTSATIDAALPAGTNAIGKLSANSGVDIGDVDVTSISAGSNLIGDVGISGARTSGGTTIFRSIDLDESEEEIKASAGQVYWIHAMNLAATKRYLKFYNATAANVTVGTTTPVLTFPLPTTGDTNGAGFTFCVPNGIAFSTAITAAATTGVADNDTGAPGANEVIVNIGYA